MERAHEPPNYPILQELTPFAFILQRISDIPIKYRDEEETLFHESQNLRNRLLKYV